MLGEKKQRGMNRKKEGRETEGGRKGEREGRRKRRGRKEGGMKEGRTGERQKEGVVKNRETKDRYNRGRKRRRKGTQLGILLLPRIPLCGQTEPEFYSHLPDPDLGDPGLST